MWSNFRDVRSMAEKITSVVAPQRNVDDDEEEYSDEEYDEEDDEYEDDEGIDESQEASNGAAAQSGRSPFSIVGMLSRAMDTEQQRKDNDESHSGENEVSEDEHLDLLEDEVDVQGKPELNRYDSPAASMTLGVEYAMMRPPQNGVDDVMPNHRNTSELKEAGTFSFSSMDERTRESGSSRKIDGAGTYTNTSSSSPNHDQQPMRYSLVRESGSVTPQPSRKGSVGARLGMSSPSRLSVRSLGSTPSGNEVTLSPLKTIAFEPPAVSDSFSTVSTEMPSSAKRDAGSGSMRPKTDPLLGSFSMVNTEKVASESLSFASETGHQSSVTDEVKVHHADDASDDTKRGTRRQDSGILPKNMTSAVSGGTGPRASSLPSISLGSMDEEEEEEDEEDVPTPAPPSGNPPINTYHAPSEDPPITANPKTSEPAASVVHPSDEEVARTQKLELRCMEREKQCVDAENQVAELLRQIAAMTEQAKNEKEEMAQRFHDKEVRLMQATAEEHEQELFALRQESDEAIKSMERQLLEERTRFQQQQVNVEGLLADANNRIQSAEQQVQAERNSSDGNAAAVQQQQARALRMTEDKLVQAMARLDERNDTVEQQAGTIKALEAKLTEQKSREVDGEKEMAALDTENEDLHNQVENMKIECAELRKRNAKLESDSEKLVHLKMELRMLKEDHSREQAKVQTVAASAESSTAQLEGQRDEALARVHDLQLQLAAAVADIDVAKSDAERAILASSNLQAALEAFQNEREAEMAMIEETRKDQEQAMAAAHAAVLDATHEAHLTEIQQIQRASDAAVSNSMEEIKRLEEKLEMFRVENVQTRRSLDEAIKRLQATQDDVIDRSFMKNVLLDWLSKSDRKEKNQVLELMASILHFTDAEKERVNIDEGSALRKLVAPPPSKVDLEKLEGENVREKWVNFLIAETED